MFSRIIRNIPEQNEKTSKQFPNVNANPTPTFYARDGSIDEFKILPINPIVQFRPKAKANILPQNHQVIMTP